MRIFRHRKSCNRGTESGQAYTEFLVLTLALVPLYLSIQLVGKYLDVKQKNIEAGRYAVWERAVFSDANAPWNNAGLERSKADADIAREVDERLFGHPLRPLSAPSGTSNEDTPLWQTHDQQPLLEPAGSRASTTIAEGRAPAGVLVVDQVAHDGLPLLGSAINAISDAIAALGEPIGCDGIGVDFESGLNLGAQNFVQAQVSTPLTLYFLEEPQDLTMTSNAGLLTNAWSAPSERVFRDRVDQLVFDEAVGCITVPAQVIGLASFGPNTALFGEALNAHPVEASVDSSVLLPDYVDD